MAEIHFNKDGPHARPPSRIMYRTQRSLSISNELQQEPILQLVLRRELKLSTTSNADAVPTLQRRSRVAQLRDKYEKFNATCNDVLSTNKNSLSSSMTSQTAAFTSSDKKILLSPLAPSAKQKKITTVALAKFVPTRHATYSSIESTIHNVPDPILNNKISNDSNDQLLDNTTLLNDRPNSFDSMISSTSQSSSLREEPFTPQPTIENDNNLNTSTNSDNDSLDTSYREADKNTNIKKETNLFKPFEEVYETELTYVQKLRVLCYKLSKQVKETCENEKNLIELFKVVYKPLQKILEQLYKFHCGVILPDIEEFKTNHRTDNMWSIFQDHFPVIEELYKEYYIIYDENQQKIERLCKMYPLINQAMLQCQVYLQNLYPISELNCANQRLLRYILLINNYLKRLDESSPQYEQTCFIHDELNRIASRCEDHLAVSPAQLKRLKARFDNKPECFETQQLIWHGLLKKQSPRIRTGIGQSYIILFSDCILVCRESGIKLEMKRQLLLKNITVDIIESRRLAPTTFHSTYGQQFSTIIYYPFRVNAIEKSYEFLVDREQDREKWVIKIRQANEEFERRRSDVEVRRSCHRLNEEQYGIRAPPWVNDTDVTRCQICNTRFGSKLIAGRHHCRSCGRCVCHSCSTKKLILKYCDDKGEKRVCDTCYTHFTGFTRNPITSTKTLRNPDRTILFGDFQYISSNSIVWIDLQEDYQLHIYGAKLDQVEDFCINLPEVREISFIENTRTFILNMKDKIFKFTIELNHQIIFQENDYINQTVKNEHNKSLFYANLWRDTMQLARLKTIPFWYTRKRDSADSGVSTL